LTDRLTPPPRAYISISDKASVRPPAPNKSADRRGQVAKGNLVLNGVCSAHGMHTFQARAGHHLPSQRLTCGRQVFEELGSGFSLLAFDADDQTIATFEQSARSLGTPLKVICDSYRDGRTDYGSRLILVRPDQYVVWAGDRPPDSAREVIGKAVGRK
jgi:hypothetical protein